MTKISKFKTTVSAVRARVIHHARQYKEALPLMINPAPGGQWALYAASGYKNGRGFQECVIADTPVNTLIPFIVCFDNGGKTADQYTAFLTYTSYKGKKWGYISMSGAPFHPLGIGLHNEGDTFSVPRVGDSLPGCDDLGHRIHFSDLPEDCQRCVRQDIESDIESMAWLKNC